MATDTLVNFFRAHPFWAIFIIVFTALPIIGAVVHIILKAMGQKGIDNTLPPEDSPDVNQDDDVLDHHDHTPLDSKK